MKSKKILAALGAAAALAWGSAQAAPDLAEGMPDIPGVIILEIQPGMLGGVSVDNAQDQALLGMLLLQLLSAMQGEGENIEVQFVAPPQGERI